MEGNLHPDPARAPKGYHSEAYTFRLARRKLGAMPAFNRYRLWASIVTVADDKKIVDAERRALRRHFDRYLELPPYN